MKSSTHLPSLLGSLLFAAGAIIFLSVALVLGIVIFGNMLIGKTPAVREALLLAIMGFEGVLLLGAAFFSLQKFLQKHSADAEIAFTITAGQIAACLIGAGVAILLGWQIFNHAAINWLLLPLLIVPAVLLPILVLLGLGVRGIPLGPRWRTWNVVGIS
ncbi:MAG: hypothetical protein ACM3XO_05780, partial [Bacteroidota bacterium]